MYLGSLDERLYATGVGRLVVVDLVCSVERAGYMNGP
jgi:hypothetical protein